MSGKEVEGHNAKRLSADPMVVFLFLGHQKLVVEVRCEEVRAEGVNS